MSRSRSRSRSEDSREKRSDSRSDRGNGDADSEDAKSGSRSRSRSPAEDSREKSPVSDKSKSRSPSRSKSPARSASPERSKSTGDKSVSRSRSRSRSKSRERSKRRERSASIERSRSRERDRSRSRRRKSRSKSRDRSRRRSRSRSRGSRSNKDWKRKLDKLIDRGHIRSGDIDSYAMDQLDRMKPEEASCVIDRFGEARFTRIGSKAGFLMGIIRRVQQEGPDGGRGDLKQLPRSVRHKLEDLIDRRQVSQSDLDKRMVNTLAGLSHSDAMLAVQRFADTPLDNIRNKTAYMMSLIRRIQGPSRSSSRR